MQEERKEKRITLAVSSEGKGELKLEKFRQTCRNEYKVHMAKTLKWGERFPLCNRIHHSDSFLKLGPFNIEVVRYEPYRILIHDFFTDFETQWVKTVSYPALSSIRAESVSFKNYSNNAMKEGSVRIVGKAVQVWISDLSYTEKAEYLSRTTERGDVIYEQLEIKELYSYNVDEEILLRISHRIQHATRMNITSRWGATPYQVTNYGLGGMVECHVDPYGYESEVPLDYNHRELVSSGDYIATFMGWINNVQAGGATGFIYDGYESSIKPKKGSAAFWINLDASHWKDPRSTHGGCPVLRGSKWILNKWIFSFDQWKIFPCSTYEYHHISPFT